MTEQQTKRFYKLQADLERLEKEIHDEVSKRIVTKSRIPNTMLIELGGLAAAKAALETVG